MQTRSAVLRWGVPLLAALALSACNRQTRSPGTVAQSGEPTLVTVDLRQIRRHVRATGAIQPVEAVTLAAPQLYEGGELVLTKIARSGTRVEEGETVAEFDRTRSLERARDAL